MVFAAVLSAADLNITSQNGQTYDGGTYDKLVISNSQNITVLNCNFSAASGHVVDITSSSTNILVENCDVNGMIHACTGVNIGGGSNGITIKDCDIHDIADDGFQIVGANYFQAVGKPQHALFLGLSRQVMLLIPMLLVFPHFFGLQGVWLAIPTADFSASLLTGIWLRRELRQLHGRRCGPS